MESEELIKLLSKQWCSLSDLMKICKCGRNKALEVRKIIQTKLLNDGYLLPSRNLPMKAVVDYLKIDIDYLVKMSNLTK